MFDKTKEYGSFLTTTDPDDIEQLKEIVMDNAKLCIPEEFHDSIECPIITYTVGWKYSSKEDSNA